MLNPDTNRFEPLHGEEARELTEALTPREKRLGRALAAATAPRLLRPDGTPVPAHWSVYHVGEQVRVKSYTFRVAYIGESTLLLEPVGPALVGKCDSVNTER